MTLHFIFPGDINERTGGYIYDREIITALADRGCEVILHQLPNDLPFPKELSIEKCRQVFRKIPDKGTTIVDGLAGGAIGPLIRENSERLTIISLIHLPLAATPWCDHEINRNLLRLERTALHFSDLIIVTSEFTRTTLMEPPYNCEKKKINVIEPGWHITLRKKSYCERPLKLLCVANIIERKGYTTVVDALGRLADIDWTLTCLGNMDYEPFYVRKLIKKIEDLGLNGRVFLRGPIKGEELVAEYLSADLFVFPSFYETYGMVLTEASGYGLPVVTSVDPATNRHLSRRSTLFFKPGDVETLANILRDLMSDSSRYGGLCREAGKYVPASPSWSECGEIFIRCLAAQKK